MHTGIRPLVATVVEAVGIAEVAVVEVVAADLVTISSICRVGVSGSAVCKYVHRYIHTYERTPLRHACGQLLET